MIRQYLQAFFDAIAHASLAIIISTILGIIGGIILPIRHRRWKVIAHERLRHGVWLADTPDGPKCMFRWRLENRGNEPLRLSDYNKRPIEFSFDSTARIVDHTVLKTEPPELKKWASLKLLNKSCAALDPISLNKGNSITLQFHVVNSKDMEINLLMLSVHHILNITQRDRIMCIAEGAIGLVLLVVLILMRYVFDIQKYLIWYGIINIYIVLFAMIIILGLHCLVYCFRGLVRRWGK